MQLNISQIRCSYTIKVRLGPIYSALLLLFTKMNAEYIHNKDNDPQFLSRWVIIKSNFRGPHSII